MNSLLRSHICTACQVPRPFDFSSLRCYVNRECLFTILSVLSHTGLDEMTSFQAFLMPVIKKTEHFHIMFLKPATSDFHSMLEPTKGQFLSTYKTSASASKNINWLMWIKSSYEKPARQTSPQKACIVWYPEVLPSVKFYGLISACVTFSTLDCQYLWLLQCRRRAYRNDANAVNWDFWVSQCQYCVVHMWQEPYRMKRCRFLIKYSVSKELTMHFSAQVDRFLILVFRWS